MKHLFNLSASEADGYEPAFSDRLLGEPQPYPEYPTMDLTGWRGVYTADPTILSRKEVLATAKANRAKGVQAWVPAMMEFGDEFLNVLPPIYPVPDIFAVSEPYSHTSEGHPVYLCIHGFDWRKPVCHAQYLTLKECRTVARPIQP